MVNGKTEIVLLNNFPKTNHTCPITNTDYLGECWILTCPANITRQQDNIGGCFLQTTTQPTEVDVSRYLHLTTKEVRQRYHRSLNQVNTFLEFYQWLQNYRETNSKSHCSKCGITNNGKDCLNILRCQRRQRVIQRFNKRYPLRLSSLAIKPNEFWAIVIAQSQKRIQQILSRRSIRRAIKAMGATANPNPMR